MAGKLDVDYHTKFVDCPTTPRRQQTDNSYIQLLETLNDLKSAAKDDELLLEHLPKLVVIGEESVGKSFLLQCLTNILFPTDATTCTRVPIWVECRQSPSTTFAIQSVDTTFDHFDTREELMHAIKTEQKRILGDKLKFAQTPIAIRVTSPDHMDITVVDLPGIKQSGDGVTDTRALVEKYYSNPLTLALAVQTINTTDGNNAFHDYTKRFDPSRKRTLKIITKCDVIGTEELKNNASRELNDQESPTHAVVCSPHGLEYSSIGEKKTFESFTRLNTTARLKYTGIAALRDRMVSKFAFLLKETIPDMSRKYHGLLSKLSQDVHLIGEIPPNVHDVRGSMIQTLRIHATVRLEEEITVLCQQFHLKIAAAQQQCIKQKNCDGVDPPPGNENLPPTLPVIYTDDHFKLTQFTPSFFQGEREFQRCIFRFVQEVWSTLLVELQQEILTKFQSGDYIHHLLSTNKFPEGLRQSVIHKWSMLWTEANLKFAKKCNTWLEENSRFSESNHAFEAEVRNKLLVCPDDLQWRFIEHFGEVNFNDHDHQELKQRFQRCVDSYIGEILWSPDIPQRKLLHDMVQACYASKSKALEISVSALTRTCLLDAFDNWLDSMRGDPELLQHCKEDESIRWEREVLLKRQQRLRRCLAVLSGMAEGQSMLNTANSSFEVVGDSIYGNKH